MKLKLYCVYDKTTCFHHPPMVAHNDEHACRKMMDLLAVPGNNIIMHASEYELWLIGSYNDLSAELEKLPRKLICNLSRCVDQNVLENEKNALFTRGNNKEMSLPTQQTPTNTNNSKH